MDVVQAIVLGLIQGLVEWLPLSSQAQVMVAAMLLFGETAEQALRYAVFLHIGTLLAAVLYFRTELRDLLLRRDNALLRFLVIAVVATAITGIPSYLLLKQIVLVPYLLLFIGLFLIATGVVQWKRKLVKNPSLSGANALFLGLGQGFSVLPGVSRSGVTTSILLFEGFPPEKAFRLSFLLSIPSVFLAEIGFGLMEPIAFDAGTLVALATAFIAGFVSITALLAVAKKINFALFCVGFGLLYIVVALVHALG